MSLANNFERYKDEIELIRAQNRVECDLYSIIACIIRERKQGNKISLRDVSVRRETDFSRLFMGKSGFPDFVIRTRDKSNEASILGAVEIKYVDENLDLENHLEQLSNHLDFYKRVIYTNGLKWRYYERDKSSENNLLWETNLGEICNEEIEWNEDNKWTELLGKLDDHKWS